MAEKTEAPPVEQDDSKLSPPSIVETRSRPDVGRDIAYP